MGYLKYSTERNKNTISMVVEHGTRPHHGQDLAEQLLLNGRYTTSMRRLAKHDRELEMPIPMKQQMQGLDRGLEMLLPKSDQAMPRSEIQVSYGRGQISPILQSVIVAHIEHAEHAEQIFFFADAVKRFSLKSRKCF